jgi:hypothetical protein
MGSKELVGSPEKGDVKGLYQVAFIEPLITPN